MNFNFILLIVFNIYSNFAIAEDIRQNQPILGVRPNCSEVPISMDALNSIATDSADMLDFLNKIPEGSLQGFTFITNSLSLHRGKKDKNGEGQVSPMWPRVLRSSIDSKITISFVCDPKNPTYGKIEIMHFDDSTKEFKMTEYDLSAKLKSSNSESRIHKNPTSCIQCHAGSTINNVVSLKPNWPEYFQWSDCKENRDIQMYGGNDDEMDIHTFRTPLPSGGTVNNCNNEDFEKSNKIEKENFLKFKEMQKDNPCFKTLPWIKKLSEDDLKRDPSLKYYPYTTSSGFNPLFPLASVSPNGRLTEAYSTLMSERILRLFKDNPDYEKVKYLLAMEAINCKIPSDMNSEILSSNSANDPQDYSNPLLNRFANHVGLKAKDWTMKFLETENPNYETGVLPISQNLGGEIIRDLQSTNPAFKNIPTDGKGRFTKPSACFNTLKGISSAGQEWCPILLNEHKKNLLQIKNTTGPCDSDNKLNSPQINEKIVPAIEKIITRLDQDSKVRGKKLVEADSKGKCVMCHTASSELLPANLRFIPSDSDKDKEKSITLIKSRKNDIGAKIETHLIEEKTMPPISNSLTDQDREDIKAYLLSLTK